jgi:hypothetical protein
MGLYAIWALSGTLLLFWLLGVTGVWPVGPSVHLLLLGAVAAMSTTVFSRPKLV